ncbi:MAG: P-loop NTPase fold protein [Bacilli bacterium]
MLPQLFEDRKKFLNSLIDLIGSLKINITDKENTNVISIDADWGYGKTTFIKHLENELTEQEFTVFTFDAWSNDFEDEPLSVFIQELIPQIVAANNEVWNDITNYDEKVKTFLSSVNSFIKFTTILIPQIPELDIIGIIEETKKNKDKLIGKESEAIKCAKKMTERKKLVTDFKMI